MARLARILSVLLALSAIVVANALAYKVKDKPIPTGTVGVAYTFTFEAEGGSAPHKFRVSSGGLPPGLSLSDEGALTGTPTEPGTWKFYIQAIDPTGLKSEREFTLGIDTRLLISTSSLFDGTVGVPYSTALAVTGGVATSWSVTGGPLPGGFSLSNDGVISGTATAVGTWGFAVRAANGSKSDTKSLTLVIRAPLTVSAGSLPPAVVGTQFTAQVHGAGGSGTYWYTLAGGRLPAGLTLDSSTGVIDGVPLAAGPFPLKIGVTASGGGAAQWDLLLLVRGKLAFGAPKLPRGKLGKRYAGSIAIRGGTAPLAFASVGSFPPGVTLNGETGKFRGTPKRRGTYRVNVRVTDSFGGSIARQLVIIVTR